jgi:hypothetical protein
VAGLSDLERLSLGAAAVRLRAASRTVVEALGRHEVPVAPSLTPWPHRPRRGGWARGEDGDQAEDERLREVAEAGLRSIAELRTGAPGDPLVRLADATMSRAASAYLRASDALHDARRAEVTGDSQPLRRATSELLSAVDRVIEADGLIDAVRLLPPSIATAGYVLGDDLEPIPVSAAERWGLDAQLARHVDGTLALLDAHGDSLPGSIVAAVPPLVEALHGWDSAAGSFRSNDIGGVRVERRAAVPAPAYEEDVPKMAQLVLAQQSLGWRMDELGDRFATRAHHLSTQPIAELNGYLLMHDGLRGGRLSPLSVPARDDVYRDFALSAARAFERYAAECFDSADLGNHGMGRSLLRARDAAVQYLAASEALSERLRREYGRGAPTVALALQAVDGGLAAVRRALTTSPMGEVAVAELGAAAHDVEKTRGQAAARPSIAGASRAVGGLERQACRSVCWLLTGDAATQLALHAEGRRAHEQLTTAWHGLEAAVGVRHDLASVPAPPPEPWLCDFDLGRADHGPERVGTIIARLRLGLAVARDHHAHHGRGPAASW